MRFAMRSGSTADDIEINVKSLINRKPNRIGNLAGDDWFIGDAVSCDTRIMNCAPRELNPVDGGCPNLRFPPRPWDRSVHIAANHR